MKLYKKLFLTLFTVINLSSLSGMKHQQHREYNRQLSSSLHDLNKCLNQSVILSPRLKHFTQRVVNLVVEQDNFFHIDRSFKTEIESWLMAQDPLLMLDINTYCTNLQSFCFEIATQSTLPFRSLFLHYLLTHGGEMDAPEVCTTPHHDTPSSVHGLTGTPPDARDASPASPKVMTRNVYSFHNVTAPTNLDFEEEDAATYDPTFRLPTILQLDTDIALREEEDAATYDPTFRLPTILQLDTDIALRDDSHSNDRFLADIYGQHEPITTLFPDVPYNQVETESDSE